MKKFTFDLDAIKSMGGAEYARQEAWDISYASQAINLIANMALDEIGEPDDMQSLGNIILSLMEFINGEIKEMVAASRRGKDEEIEEYGLVSKKPGQVRDANEGETNTLDLYYVKSLGIDIPDNKLAVKYVSKNTIAHPVCIWGDTKKTNLEFEFFTKKSDFWDEALKNVNRPLTWEHGQDVRFAKFEPNPVIGQTVKYYDDDIARWAESVINTRHHVTGTVTLLGGLAGMDVRYRTRIEDVLAFPLDERTDVTVVDLRVGYRALSVLWQARVANLFNQFYVDVQERNPGAPRSFTLTAVYGL